MCARWCPRRRPIRPRARSTSTPSLFTIYGNDQITQASVFDDVVLAFHNGAPVRVRDIGTAIDGAENTKSGSWNKNGHRSVQTIIRKQPGANVVETVERIDDKLKQLNKALPPSIRLLRYADRMQTINASVAEVRITLVITAFLVVAVIFAFLRNAWATIFPTTAIPLSIIGTFAGMYLLGYSIDNLLTIVAHHRRVGFCGRRRHRHAREHLPPHGRGHVAAAGGAEEAPAKSASPSSPAVAVAGGGIHSRCC